MFEIAASKKMDILASQDIIGKSNKRQINVTHEVAHILQYMTYVSTTENELTSTMTHAKSMRKTLKTSLLLLKTLTTAVFILVTSTVLK